MQRRYLLGGVLILTGAALLVSAVWPERNSWQITYTPLPLPKEFASHYPPAGLKRLKLHQSSTDRQLTVHVAEYLDASGTHRQALLPDPGSRQWQEWMDLATHFQTLEPDALILSWWHNAQRIDFLTGHHTWVRQPPEEAFTPSSRPLWRHLSGGFSTTGDRLTQLATWLTQPPQMGLDSIVRTTPHKAVYLLVSSEDLSHVDEIERLAGRKLPLELRFFPTSASLHGQIAAIRNWARQTNHGYLPQPIPTGIAAWRITQGENVPLLLRLLPFTTSRLQLPDRIEETYRSASGNLALFHLRGDPANGLE